MIQAVTSSRFPYLQVHVQIGNQQYPDHEFDVEPLVDTGFDGGLAVPRSTIPDTVTPAGRSMWNLADGSEITASWYFCYVTIGHLPPVPTVVITLDRKALLGRHVTDKFRLIFDHGRRLVVEP